MNKRSLAYDTLRERLEFAYRLAFGRGLKASREQEARAYLQQTRQVLAVAKMPVEQVHWAAWANYLRVMLSSNELLYVD